MADKKEMSAAELGARANIHGSTLRDMAAVDFNPMQERAAYNFSTGGPSGMLPQSEPPANRPAAQPAQVAATVLTEPDIERHPLAHVDQVDRLVMQTEMQERRQSAFGAGITPEVQQMMLMLAQQQQQIAKLTELLHDQETSTKKKSKTP
jgi:hypothetical protein